MAETIKKLRSNHDFAILFLRMFLGGVILLHNIGKMQDYNIVMANYDGFMMFSKATVFIVVASVQIALAIAIMVGFYTRTAALFFAITMIYAVITNEFSTQSTSFLLAGGFTTLLISGSGIYALRAS